MRCSQDSTHREDDSDISGVDYFFAEKLKSALSELLLVETIWL